MKDGYRKALEKQCITVVRRLLLGTASCLLIGWGSVEVSAQATLATTFEAAQSFFGGVAGSPVRAIAVFSNGNDLKLIDFSKNPLTIQKIASDGPLNYRAIALTSDAGYVAYAVSSKIYIRPVRAGATTKLAVGDGEFPNFWVHPQTKKVYILYKEVGSMADSLKKIFSQEVDLAALQLVGQRAVSVSNAIGGPPNAGRSPDGRFMTADDAVHGMYELEDPLAVTNAKVKNYVYITTFKGYPELAAGWCNASISPAMPGSKFYACAQHMGTNHTDCFVRKWPDDLKSDSIAPNHSHYAYAKPGEIRSTDAPMVHIKPKDGCGVFHGTFWSTHDSYITAKAAPGTNKNTDKWYGYLYDISALNDSKYLRILSLNLNKSNDFIQLWVNKAPARVRWASRNGKSLVSAVPVRPAGRVILTCTKESVPVCDLQGVRDLHPRAGGLYVIEVGGRVNRQ